MEKIYRESKVVKGKAVTIELYALRELSESSYLARVRTGPEMALMDGKYETCNHHVWDADSAAEVVRKTIKMMDKTCYLIETEG